MRHLLLLIGCAWFVSCSPDSRIEPSSIEKWNNYTMERIYLNAFDDTPIPMILLKPDENKKKHSTVLLIHGMSSSKDQEWLGMYNAASGEKLLLQLLQNGYIVAAIDTRMHGERTIREYPQVIGHNQKQFDDVIAHWADFYRNTTQDIITTLDYLEQRKDVSKQNIGILGYSLGSLFAVKMGATQSDRIKTVVAAVPPIDKNFSGSLNLKTDASTLQIPVFLLAADSDEWTPLENSKEVFDVIPSQDKKIEVYHTSHSLPLSYIQHTVDWFNVYLK